MLFKKSENAKAEEIKQYIAVNSSLSFDAISPYIDSAETTYLKKILGLEQYTELIAFYNSSSADWDEREEPKTERGWMDKLLKLVQKALINLAMHDGFPILSVNLGDSGAFRKETESQKALYQYQEEALKKSFRTEGFNTLDAILEFLEENITEFPIFEASDTYTVFKSKFIRTAPEFSNIYHINNSRLVFLHLQSYIELVNDFELKPVLGRWFMEELVYTMQVGADLMEHQVELINFIKKIQAYLAIAKGISALGVDISHNGAYFHSNASGGSNYKRKESVNSEDLHIVARNAEDNGRAYIQYMKDFLHEHIDYFPTYADFYSYNEGEEIPFRDNTDKKTHWA